MADADRGQGEEGDRERDGVDGDERRGPYFRRVVAAKEGKVRAEGEA